MTAQTITLQPGDTLTVTAVAAGGGTTPPPTTPGAPDIPNWPVENVSYGQTAGQAQEGEFLPGKVYRMTSQPMPPEPYNSRPYTYASNQCPNGGTRINAAFYANEWSPLIANPNPSFTAYVGPDKPMKPGDATVMYFWLPEGLPATTYRFSQVYPA